MQTQNASREIMEQAIQAAISKCANDEGWANLAELGTELRKQDIKYGKLSRFFQSYSNIVETRIDETVAPPVVYARLKQE